MLKKICVITGGANGIGRCLVETFVAHSEHVAFIDKDKKAGEKLAGQLGDRVTFMHGDIADETMLGIFAKYVIDRFGSIDCLINNAAVSHKGILSDCSFSDFSHALRVGVVAPYMLAKLFRDHFAPGASIINISSTRAFMSSADTESYSAAKGAINALTHALAVSLAGRARVNSISPGWIDTSRYRFPSTEPVHPDQDRRQHPARRVGKPEDIAELALFLSKEKAGFITGQNFTVDGGMTVQMIYHDEDGWSFNPDSV